MNTELNSWQETQDLDGEIIDDTKEASRKMDELEREGQPISPEIQKHRDSVRRSAQEIVEQKNLPRCGESKTWVNQNQPDKQPENPDNPEVKMLTWNIERGYKVDEQIKHLRKEDPDILCLQEVDLDCERTGNQNIALKVAQELGYKYVVYTTEFLELDGDEKDFPLSLRGKLKKIGKGGGAHGHAILSKYPIENTSAIKLDNLWHDWEGGKQKMSKREPREGQRVAQKIDIKIGNKTVTIYNTHLEDKTNTTGRLAQWDQIANDAEKNEHPTIITGDLNTVSHGIANALPNARNNFFGKRRRLGQKDSEHWRKHEFQSTSGKKTFNDPTSKSTFNIGPLYKAKLDWFLLEDDKFTVKKSETGPKKLSDHRPISATIQLD